jgi:hypothetical protein
VYITLIVLVDCQWGETISDDFTLTGDEIFDILEGLGACRSPFGEVYLGNISMEHKRGIREDDTS